MAEIVQRLTKLFGLTNPTNWVGPALVLALLMMGGVIGLFSYLRRRVKQPYFNLWTAAWSGYAVYLLTALVLLKFPNWVPLRAVGLCGIGLSGLFMCWGSLHLANKLRFQRAMWVLAALVTIYCLGAGFLVADPFWGMVVVFGLLGGVGIYTGLLSVSRHRSSTDAKILGVGLALWSLYVAFSPFLNLSPLSLAAGQLAGTALAVLVAMAMVLEQSEDLSERNYGSLFDTASDAIFLLDMWRLTVIKANRAAQHLTKIPLAELGGIPFGKLCPAVDRNPASALENERMYRACFQPYEKINLQMANGTKAVCEGEVKVVIWRHRPVLQVSIRDVGERTQMAEQIHRHERLSTVGQLVAGVAHELNNPLAVIQGTAQLLVHRNHLDGQVKKDLDCIQKQSERASQIVCDLLSYARPSEPNKTVIHINRIVTEGIEWRRSALEAAGIQVETRLAPTITPTKADRVQVEQILSNLLGNAIDALQERRTDRQIVVTTEELPGCLRVTVQDNGPGIARDVVEKIYDPFFTTKPVGRGTGLGLTICNTYAREHRGKLWVESEPGKGARFILELPLLPCEPEVPAVKAAPEERRVAVPSQSRRRLLIVDDEPDIVTVLESILGEFGYDTRSAANGTEALDILSRETFDVILSDMRMPGMDGETLYQRLCEAKPGLAKRVIFVTGDTVSTKTREFLDATGNLWLSKPFQMKDVIHRVESILMGPSHATPAPLAPVGGPV
jgi:two-component system NtrC family sensor kinase